MGSLYQDLMKWKKKYDCELAPPAKKELIDGVKKELSPFPPELEEFYKITNGLSCEWFEILPIEDPAQIRETWDGIKRANNKKTTKFLGNYLESHPNLLDEFLIFAHIGGLQSALYNKNDFKIWYEDTEGLHDTTLNLREFIHTVLREVQEL